MYIRVIRIRTKPDQVREYVRRWRRELAPALRQLPGFQHAYVAADIARNAITTVTLWEDLPHVSDFGPVLAAFEPKVIDLLAAPAVMEEFQVLAELDADSDALVGRQ